MDSGRDAIIAEAGHIDRSMLLQIRSNDHSRSAGANLGPEYLSRQREHGAEAQPGHRRNNPSHCGGPQTHQAAAGFSFTMSWSRKRMALVKPSSGDRMLSSCSI